MPISTIFQGNSQSVPESTPASGGSEVINSYEDTTDVRVNHNIPNLIFAGILKGFRAFITVSIDKSSTDLSETFEILGTNNGTSWSISSTSVANTNGTANISFSITNAGQMQYSSTSTAGFIKRTLLWSTQSL
jgi:hypothetical protein